MIDPLTTNNAIYRDSLTLKLHVKNSVLLERLLTRFYFNLHCNSQTSRECLKGYCVLIKLTMLRDEIFFSIAINEIRQLKFEVVQAKIDDKNTVWYIRKTKKSGSAK